ncbi:MAG TPA: alpha-1,4-glucan--maltose-1-phosphate maltosyltransferase [Casimicrobiaceae bacterium]|nr:alpha-1,4-glucan--maltose-1-phosphate maltosyltransferase [Casimicrobiaceae bacterium]
MAARKQGARSVDTFPVEGRARAVIEAITPQVDGGRFAAKRIVGDRVVVEADCFADGHDVLACRLRFRRDDEAAWNESPMAATGNDRWRGEFIAADVGRYRYTVSAWVDAFLSWRHDFERRLDADDMRVAAQVGAGIVAAAAARARGDERKRLTAWARELRGTREVDALRDIALDDARSALAQRYPDRRFETTFPVELPLVVDRPRAGFSSWYELFPRSTAQREHVHGTFADCEARLPYVAQMGFDVLYLPPIHPIGRVRRKGRNNALVAGADDVGSPWAIGAAEGGHTALHPQLGTIDDFRRLAASARSLGLEIALDIAFQCAPDHPYVEAHPEWFRHRPDGSVQYAENPPKKYQDIYPFNFDSDEWRSLWAELYDVIAFWIGEGVRIFRVDNPHTKPFAFWEWAIARIKREYPDVILLSEAFTRPKVMHRLAKLGFTQSYTYFTWRNSKHELTEYFTELDSAPGRDYFRPNCWPNTPDILPESLQIGRRPAFMTRLILAATLCANYGIYGPAFELLEHVPREPGAEEYLHSEKYELRHWDIERADTLAPFIARVNAARRDNRALQHGASLVFFPTDNDEILCCGRIDAGKSNAMIVVVNLDPHHVQSGWVTLDLAALGVEPDQPFQVHDLLTDARYAWHGARNFVLLDPARVPAHLFRVRRHVRNEHDFAHFE